MSFFGTKLTNLVDDHIACAVAGITADANILIHNARVSAQQYLYAYQEPVPVEYLVQQLCDLKQGYTQYGGKIIRLIEILLKLQIGLRPFGVSFLYAGYDKNHGFQLYQSDPSGNYGGWKATAIGANNQASQSILRFVKYHKIMFFFNNFSIEPNGSLNSKSPMP